MLKAAGPKDIAAIDSFLGNGIIPMRIRSYMLAYGFDKEFVRFWISENGEKIDVVIALFEDSLLLYVDITAETAEITEITAFISMLQFTTLSCEKEAAEMCGFKVYTEKEGYVFNGVSDGYSAENIDEDKIRDAYTLICESIPDSFSKDKSAYLSFLSDYTYRNRRNLSRGKCLTENGSLVSCAFTSAETESEALLSGVATDSNLRKGGYGKRTVLSLVNELLGYNKTPYVIALNDSAKSFYEHIGFKKDKIIVYANRKDI